MRASERSPRKRSRSETGIVAGAFAALGAGPVVDPGYAWLVAGLTGLVWAAATGLYLCVYDELDGVPADPDEAGQWAGAKWGGIVGGMTVGTGALASRSEGVEPAPQSVEDAGPESTPTDD